MPQLKERRQHCHPEPLIGVKARKKERKRTPAQCWSKCPQLQMQVRTCCAHAHEEDRG
eukprot:CAMPEP_0171101320 /NCGR_PEP_ID=MMETSP0766_2-20121228/54623_1 /TAXON_ID=439317 /ORGANISM="Gambierdiscus australes, Strain CAWD 149" /LENGTH=57 /DNA_ID=CAMNT_0011561343 /DNA_START=68 /DNA_END=238 /DNA_ORIENTATION=+